MTSEEFDLIDTYDELIEFMCDCEYEGDLRYDLLTESSYQDAREEELSDLVGERCWQDIRDIISSWESGYDCYERNDYGEYSYLYDSDDRFYEIKEILLGWAEENDIFEPEDDDEEGSDEVEVEEDPVDDFSVEEGCSFDEMTNSGYIAMQEITNKENADMYENICKEINLGELFI